MVGEVVEVVVVDKGVEDLRVTGTMSCWRASRTSSKRTPWRMVERLQCPEDSRTSAVFNTEELMSMATTMLYDW